MLDHSMYGYGINEKILYIGLLFSEGKKQWLIVTRRFLRRKFENLPRGSSVLPGIFKPPSERLYSICAVKPYI